MMVSAVVAIDEMKLVIEISRHGIRSPLGSVNFKGVIADKK
jgi:hypothetical protein